jgi:hypothetical protein
LGFGGFRCAALQVDRPQGELMLDFVHGPFIHSLTDWITFFVFLLFCLATGALSLVGLLGIVAYAKAQKAKQ